MWQNEAAAYITDSYLHFTSPSPPMATDNFSLKLIVNAQQ